MLVVYICAALKISTGTPASRGPSATAGLLVHFRPNDELTVCGCSVSKDLVKQGSVRCVLFQPVHCEFVPGKSQRVGADSTDDRRQQDQSESPSVRRSVQ